MNMNWAGLWNHLSRRIRTWVQTEILKRSIGRQKYPIGKTGNLGGLYVALLDRLHYQDNHLAFCDRDEAFNVRRLKRCGLSWYQIHVRGYVDGEVRGHYEVTPESDPWRHYHGTTVQQIPTKELGELQEAIKTHP